MRQQPIFTEHHPVRRALETEGVRLIDFLGRGGFNEAWSADYNDARICVKLSIEPLDAPTGKTAVEFEANKIFKHPQIAMHAYIVKYFGHKFVQGHLATFWELGGRSLHDLLDEIQAKEGRSGLGWHELVGDETTATGYLWSVARAIDDFNNLGHQHRDIKPQNLIMFFGNQVKLGDLGLAKFIGDSTHRSRFGAGTLGYQPPEAQQRAWKSQSDGYSFWATYIKLRTGHEPFGDENPADVYERQRQGAPVLDGLEDFERGPILHGLAPRPEDRPHHGVAAQLRLLQPGREHVLAPASRPFVAPQSVVIEAIVVPEVRVEPPMVRVAPASAEGLPEVPKETLDLLGRRRGLDQAIAELKAGRHPALRPASAAVEMAARQEQEMRADLAAHAPKLPTKLCQEIVRRVSAEPGGSIASLMRLDPKADANELQQFILRVRNLELASRAHQQARAEFQRSLDAEIAKLSAQRQETANQIGVWQSKDLRSIVERLHAVSGGDRHFPLVTWMRWQQPLLARYERNDIVELMESAENYYKFLDLMKSPNSFGMEFVWIDAGEFDMGSPDGVGSDNERPLHRVRITRPFLLSKYPVTVGQFRQFVQAAGYTAAGDGWTKPGFAQTDRDPVVNVSWNDAVAMANWLTQREKRTYCLPTEAEWEFACRAGTRTLHYGGDSTTWASKNANIQGTQKGTTPVGKFAPNPWGLYDMLGNTWEWTNDWFASDYYRSSPVDDPTGPAQDTYRVVRGGSWYHDANCSRSGCRRGHGPSDRYCYVGFRLLLRVS